MLLLSYRINESSNARASKFCFCMNCVRVIFCCQWLNIFESLVLVSLKLMAGEKILDFVQPSLRGWELENNIILYTIIFIKIYLQFDPMISLFEILALVFFSVRLEWYSTHAAMVHFLQLLWRAFFKVVRVIQPKLADTARTSIYHQNQKKNSLRMAV